MRSDGRLCFVNQGDSRSHHALQEKFQVVASRLVLVHDMSPQCTRLGIPSESERPARPPIELVRSQLLQRAHTTGGTVFANISLGYSNHEQLDKCIRRSASY